MLDEGRQRRLIQPRFSSTGTDRYQYTPQARNFLEQTKSVLIKLAVSFVALPVDCRSQERYTHTVRGARTTARSGPVFQVLYAEHVPTSPIVPLAYLHPWCLSQHTSQQRSQYLDTSQPRILKGRSTEICCSHSVGGPTFS